MDIHTEYKLIIAGGREFNDYALLTAECDKFIENILADEYYKIITIISGAARGADRLGERYATDNGYPLSSFPANWDLYGKSAGYKRNVQMSEEADGLIAFHDGQSRGTQHMIDIMNKKVDKIYNVEPNIVNMEALLHKAKNIRIVRY